MPRSFFFLGPVCTRWLIPITGCTAATSPREGPDLAGWKLCVEGGVPVELRDSASVRPQSNKASVKQTDKWLLTLYIYLIFYMTSSLADLSLSILILRYSEVTVFWTERDVLIWASLLFVWTAVHARQCMRVHLCPLSAEWHTKNTVVKTFEARLGLCSDRILIQIWSALPSLTVWSQFCEQCVLSCHFFFSLSNFIKWMTGAFVRYVILVL